LRVGDLGEEFARILHPQIGDFTPSGIRP
jgi:hypothetical protein